MNPCGSPLLQQCAHTAVSTLFLCLFVFAMRCGSSKDLIPHNFKLVVSIVQAIVIDWWHHWRQTCFLANFRRHHAGHSIVTASFSCNNPSHMQCGSNASTAPLLLLGITGKLKHCTRNFGKWMLSHDFVILLKLCQSKLSQTNIMADLMNLKESALILPAILQCSL